MFSVTSHLQKMILLFLTVYLLLSGHSGLTEANSTHLPRMIFTDKGKRCLPPVLNSLLSHRYMSLAQETGQGNCLKLVFKKCFICFHSSKLSRRLLRIDFALWSLSPLMMKYSMRKELHCLYNQHKVSIKDKVVFKVSLSIFIFANIVQYSSLTLC